MNDPIIVRKYVREVMALYPDRPFTERKLLDAVTRLTREELKVDELKSALRWNEIKDFIKPEKNEDLEETEWTLTALGKAKEGVK